MSSPGRFARPETGASVAPPDTSPRRRAACFADGDKTGCPAYWGPQPAEGKDSGSWAGSPCKTEKNPI